MTTLAIFGGAPAFDEPLAPGQHNLPSEAAMKTAFEAIFERRWFANNGPMVQRLDARLGDDFGRPATCVANECVAVMVAASAMNLRGAAFVPALGPLHLTQGLRWAGLAVQLVDVGPDGCIAPSGLISADDGALLGVALPWGDARMVEAAPAWLASRGGPVLWDASRAYLELMAAPSLLREQDAAVLSFSVSALLNGGEGGAVVSADKRGADRVRTARNFHLAQTFEQVALRINGKMAEAPAAMVLAGLDELQSWRHHNGLLWGIFKERSADWRAVKVFTRPSAGGEPERLWLVVEPEHRGLNARLLATALRAEGIETARLAGPAEHLRTIGREAQHLGPDTFPNAQRLCIQTLELPFGASVSVDAAHRICDIIQIADRQARVLASRVTPD